MSGGVGPTSGGGIRLQDVPPPPSAPRRFLTLPQLNAFAAAGVLAATGLVSLADVSFFVAAVAYLYLLDSVAFPSSPSEDRSPVFGRRNPLLLAWVSAGALIGLLLPVAYIVHGVIDRDHDGITAAAPHTFLLASQVFTEGLSFSRGFSIPARAFVPIFYSARRLVVIGDWVRDEMGKVEVGGRGSSIRAIIGRWLAAANLIFWSINLFVFLLPIYLPRALKRYYASKTVLAAN